jgi:hypothetical protein
MIDRHEFSEAWLGVATTGAFDISNPFLRFVAAWMAFNAVYDDGSAQGSEWGRIARYVAENRLNSHHQMLLAHSGYSEAVNTLAEDGVGDDRTGTRRTIDDVRDMLQVLRCVYQVRCNLLHGGKHPTNPRDRDLCHASYVITASLLQWKYTGKLPREAA